MRVKLIFHEGQEMEYEAPNGVQALLDDLATRCGYDIRPCLASPPVVLSEDAPPVICPETAAPLPIESLPDDLPPSEEDQA